jgi:hypothetical protein
VLTRALLAALAVATLAGMKQESLLGAPLWTAAGGRRLLAYLAGYAAAATIVVWRWPQQLARVAVAAALAWAVWWAGPAAVVAVAFFLGSCAALGRRVAPEAGAVSKTLVGAALWMTALWCALHFRVNFAWVYGMAFAVPYVLAPPRGWLPPRVGQAEAGPLAVLLGLLGVHFLAALKPEISSDGLAMHLHLPAYVARHGFWPFDHRQDVWALMPAGGDALFTGVYVLGGEAAAKLLNFAFLAMLALLLAEAARRWVAPARAWLAAALFLTTPLVLLVTGSLFVENVWAALLLAGLLGALEGRPAVAAIGCGAACAVKLIAVAFAGPLLLAVAWRAGARWWRPALVAALLAAPPYVFSYVRSGNPVFPFLNAVFRSPDYHTAANFADARYAGLGLNWKTPYELTFRSGRYIEGEGGAAGFQYFLLLLPAAMAARRREQGAVIALTVVGAVGVLLGAPNLRYLYAALALASLAVAWGPGAALWAPVMALNLWFLPAAGYYDREFTLFRKDDLAPYIAEHAPARRLIARLNREAPGEPVAFLGTDATAGLAGRVYTSTWHSEHFWQRVRDAETPAEIARYLGSLGIRNLVAPADRSAQFDVVRRFLERWVDPWEDGAVGPLGLFRVRDKEAPAPKDMRPLEPGSYDDTEPRIEYSGAWFFDPQFPQSRGSTLHYSWRAGDAASFRFAGAAVVYSFTRAANRGIAEIWIDGQRMRRIDLYAPETVWRAEERLEGLAAGVHAFELRVTGEKSARSSGAYVDLDAVIVE